MKIPSLKRRKDRDLWFVYHGGRRVYMGPEKVAARRYRLWLANTFGVGPVQRGPITIANVAVAWLEYAEEHYESKAEREHCKSAVEFLIGQGDDPAAEFGPAKLAIIRAAMLQRPTWSRRYVARQIARIRRMFRWAAGREMVPASVAAGLAMLDPIKVEPREVRRPPPPLDIARTLAELPPTLTAMIWLQILTGCRPQAVCGMTSADVDRSATPWEWRPPQHKKAWRGADLVIWLGPQAREVVAPFLAGEPSVPCFSPRVAERERSRRPRPNAGAAYTTHAYGNAIRRACERAGVRVWAPGVLRHLRASQVEERHGAEAVQAVLDHDRLDTQRHYLNRRRQLAKEIAEAEG